MHHDNRIIENILASRGQLPRGNVSSGKSAEEGGCGVTGFIASIPVSGRHIFEPSVQMHNRGNGKGGGIAAVGLSAQDLGVTQEVLDTHYLLQIALLQPEARPDVEAACINPCLEVHKAERIPTRDDYREVEGLEIQPPDVWRYFVRVKKGVLERFVEEQGLRDMDPLRAEDEYIYQNSYRINQKFYASLGEKQAFVLSHGRNIMILKIVGYAEQVAQYYLLDDFKAHGWIAHQRYPTKGRVWHPGGAHPFIGMDEALVHNGDFANYHAVSEYLKQHNIFPQFLTDTEVSVLLFDLLNRTFNYPMEYIIEAIAPTSEYDFDQLPPEKQAIDATLQSLAAEDSRFCPVADKYWNARGGSSSDGGSFIFTVKDAGAGDGSKTLVCTNKFGEVVRTPSDQQHYKLTPEISLSEEHRKESQTIVNNFSTSDSETFKDYCAKGIANWDYETLRHVCTTLLEHTKESDEIKASAIDVLTHLNDRHIETGTKKRSSVLHLVRNTLSDIFVSSPRLNENSLSRYRFIDWSTRTTLRAPREHEGILVLNAREFPPEGDACDSRLICAAYELGWRQFICYGYKGQRFTGCGLGNESDGVRIDVYDSSGDYLASGIDGLEIYVHGNAQDQLGQIMKRGKLVVYGDVGQTFMYGAKGGEVYVMGNAAGRPLINAVGRPRVVINGTCLDYLAESFMAGDPLNGGGFVVLNGISFDNTGKVVGLDTPYPGSNLFSLASGGAIYVRDPHHTVVEDQLNGGEIVELSTADWGLIRPYLEENERLFGISIAKDLLTVGQKQKNPQEVYRKVKAVQLDVLTEVEDD